MKYTPALLGVGQLSGKGGSVVASHNRFGSYLRNRVIPTNPRTTLQTFRRNNFAEISTAWRSLTSEQRSSFEATASQLPKTNPQGETYYSTGFGLFMEVNTYRLLFGQAILTTAFVPVDETVITNFTITAEETPATLSIAFTPTPLGAGRSLIVYGTGPKSAGVSFVPRSEYKLLAVGAAAQASPMDVLAAWNAKYGPVLAGQRIFLMVKSFDTNYMPGATLERSAIAIA